MQLDDLFNTDVPQENCKGVIYKADVQHCKTERGILYSIRLNKLKRMSCPGCNQCVYIEDDINEIGPGRSQIKNIEMVEHGKLYTIEVCDISRDYETGIIDDWNLEVVEYVAT